MQVEKGKKIIWMVLVIISKYKTLNGLDPNEVPGHLGAPYIYMSYICCENCWIKKNRKKEAPLPSAADGKGSFAVCRGRQRSHAAATCAPWELTHLVSLPTAADGKGFAYSGRRQRLVPQ